MNRDTIIAPSPGERLIARVRTAAAEERRRFEAVRDALKKEDARRAATLETMRLDLARQDLTLGHMRAMPRPALLKPCIRL